MNLSSRDIALTGVFASLYAVLSTIPLFPIIGVVGRSFTVALLIAPLVGIIIGPIRGALAASIGGSIGWFIAPQYGPLVQFSFVPGAATALCAGYLYKGRWKIFVAVYSVLFLAYGLYPKIGPLWLYPYYVWFNLLGLIVLLFQWKLKNIKPISGHGVLVEWGVRVGVISLIATLFGHIVGGLIFEAISPIYFPDVAWMTLWQILIFVYPVERSIVVLVSILVGAPLIRALKAHGFEIGGK